MPTPTRSPTRPSSWPSSPANLNGSLTIGEALTEAKQQYAAGNAILSPYDLKALMESTFYGLPMYHLNTSPTPATTILQVAPSSGTANAGTGFTDQLAVSGASGTVSYNQLSGSPDLTVSSTGSVSASTSLAVGTYTATGTDIDQVGDTGTWTYTLSVTPAIVTDSVTGLSIAPVTLSLPTGSGSGDLESVPGANGGTYYEVSGAQGGGTQTTEYRPIEPLVTVPVTEPNLVPHGALVTALTSTDVSGFTPAYSLPAVGSNDSSPPAIGDAAFPGTLQRVASYGTFTSSGTGQDAQLDLVAGQFFPDPSTTTGTGTERLFTSMSAQVYYDAPGSALANDYTPPTIDSSQATDPDGNFSFDVKTTPSSSGDPVTQVVVLYKDAAASGAWTEVTLSSSDSENWTGTSNTSSEKIQYIVEAIDAAGNVAVSNNEGVDFNALTETTTSLSASSSPATIDTPVSFIATVAPSSGTGAPTGSVEFLDGGSPINACGGTTGAAISDRDASCTVTYSASGDHSITADYLGDSNFEGSQSSVEDLTVSNATTTTATSLSLSTPSVTYGDDQAVTFNANVTSNAGTPSGTVVVAAGATTLCTIALPATSCSSETPALLAGSTTAYSVTASYPGVSGLGASTSPPQTLSVDPANSTASLSLSTPSVTYGDEQAVSFTAEVSPQYSGTPTGTISVETGRTTLCTIALPATSCSATDPTVLAASTTDDDIQAFYSGDSNFEGSTSTDESLTVNPAAATTSLQASTTSPSVGESVTYTATVTGPSGGATPTGTVSFDDGSSKITCTGGDQSLSGSANTATATCLVSYGSTSGNPHSITAVYVPAADTNYSAGSPSSVVGVSVAALGASVSVSSGDNPIPVGTPVTYTATVTGSGDTPSGTTTFYDNGTAISSCGTNGVVGLNASGSATCTVSYPNTTASPHAITASYSGDDVYNSVAGSADTVSVSEVVSALPASVAVINNTVSSGGTLIFTATVSGSDGTPTGSVTWLLSGPGSPTCSNSMLSGGVTACSITNAQAGAYTAAASYGGNSVYSGSSGSDTTATVTMAATTTTVSFSGSASVGSSETVTATVAPTDNGGTVNFTATLGTSPVSLPAACTGADLSSGKATCIFTPASPGSYSFTAGYSGDSNYTTSSGTGPLSVAASGVLTTTTLSISRSPVTYGNEAKATFTATVTGTSGSLPTGTVSIKSGSTSLCSTTTLTETTASSVTATCSLTNTEEPAGSYSVTAVYGGDTHNPGSSSSSQSLVVSQDLTATVVQELPTTIAYGSEQKVVFGVAVATGNAEELPATESVTINVGSASCVASLTPIPIVGAIGSCTITAAALPVGSYKVSTSYPGDTDLKSSSGTAAVGLTVTAAPTSAKLSLSQSSVPYGNETTEVFSATVTSSAGTPTGTVAVGSSAGALCTITLSSGSGSCHLTATQLGVATVSSVTATYGASGNFAGSSSSPSLSFSVSKDTTTTKVSESPTTVTFGDESAAVFTVTMTTAHGEPVPNNETVKVTVGSTSCTVTLSAGTGTCKIANSALAVGSYAVSASYGGDADLSGSSGTGAANLTVSKT